MGDHEHKVPKEMQAKYLAIIDMTNRFSQEKLNEEYAALARKAVAALARKKLSPLNSSSTKVWACGVIHALGMINYLYDRSSKPYVSNAELINWFDVGQSTASQKSKEIRELLKMRQFDHNWMLPSKVGGSPVVWLLSINGFYVDVRTMPLEVQEEALRRGLIPYIPALEAI